MNAALRERFDPELLIKFRKKHGLSKASMIRLLQGHGFLKLSYATYSSWEAGTHQPLALNVDTMKTALEIEGPRLEAAKKAGRDVEV